MPLFRSTRSSVIKSVVLALLVAFGGCLAPLDSEESACVREVCLSPPDAEGTEWMLKNHGLHKILDDKDSISRQQIQGDLVIWQMNQANNHGNSSILAYDIGTEKLTAISDGRYHSTLGFLSGNQVVYTAQPRSMAPDYGQIGSKLILWNVDTQENRTLDIPLGGSPYSFGGLSGDWVVFLNKGSADPAENGGWAFNLDSGAIVNLYVRTPGGRDANGDVVSQGAESVYEGKAYYSERRGPAYGPVFNDTFYEVDLESGVKRVLNAGENTSAHASSRDGSFIVTLGNYVLRFIDLDVSGEFQGIEFESSLRPTDPIVVGDLVLFVSIPEPIEAKVLSYNLRSGEFVTLLEAGPTFEFFPEQDLGSDGVRVLFSIYERNYGVFGDESAYGLYWMDLASHAGQ
jgi:hypothetical protein